MVRVMGFLSYRYCIFGDRVDPIMNLSAKLSTLVFALVPTIMLSTKMSTVLFAKGNLT